MNSTSFGSRLVRIAARSPARSSTGPEVWRRFTPISRAMIGAGVVLPSPGGPNSSTWSSASFLARAASTKIESCPRIFSCPTYSVNDRGRSARSNASSWTFAGSGAMRRSVSMATRYLNPARMRSCLGQQLQRLPDAVRDRGTFGQLLDRVQRFFLAVPQTEKRAQDIARSRRGPVHRNSARDFGTQLILQLQQQP